RRELVGDRPTRLTADVTQLVPDGLVVDLDDHTVDLVLQPVAALLPRLVKALYVVEVVEAVDLGVDAEAEFVQPVECVPVRGWDVIAVRPAELIDPYVEPSL